LTKLVAVIRARVDSERTLGLLAIVQRPVDGEELVVLVLAQRSSR
jgi:hypothetical protein